jgi:ElaB/YqjD/DUF883 family membrane-anchored ribosome-binding protein
MKRKNGSPATDAFTQRGPATPGLVQPKETAKMERRTDEFNHAKAKMTDDLKMIITDGEALLKTVANASEDSYAAARAKFAEQVTSARARLVEASRPVMKKARQADAYVHDSPWAVIGAAAALGLLIGLLASKR